MILLGGADGDDRRLIRSMFSKIKRYLRRRRSRERREMKVSEIQALGYDIVDADGAPIRGRRPLAYFIRTPSGEILHGPLGRGFPRLSEVEDAVLRHQAESRSDSPRI